jgi:hypothetical protein
MEETMAKEKKPSGGRVPEGQDPRDEDRLQPEESSPASKYGGLIPALVVLGLILLAIIADMLR